MKRILEAVHICIIAYRVLQNKIGSAAGSAVNFGLYYDVEARLTAIHKRLIDGQMGC